MYNKKMVIQKRALSPVIATVLLVMLVVVIAIIVFLAAKSLIREQLEKFEKPIEEACEQVKFDIELGDTSEFPITCKIANRGNIAINSFDLKEIKGPNSEINSLEIFVNSGKVVTKNLVFQTTEPEEIIFYPRVLGTVRGEKTNKAYTCLDNYIAKKL